MSIPTEITCLEVGFLQDPARFSLWLDRMPEYRRSKVLSMHFAEGQRLSLGVGILLFQALEKRGIDGKTVRIGEEEYGRPYLPEAPDFRFSLSHAGAWAMCAVSSLPVGCDAEQCGRGDERLVRRFFHPEEQAALSREGDPEAWQRLFTRIWTRKESWLKLTGRGLSEPTEGFSVLSPEEGVRFEEYPAAEGYAFTCCTRGAEAEKPVWRILREA